MAYDLQIRMGVVELTFNKYLKLHLISNSQQSNMFMFCKCSLNQKWIRAA